MAPRLKTLKVAEPPQAQGRRHGEGRGRAGREAQIRSEGDLAMAALVIAEHDNAKLKSRHGQRRHRRREDGRRGARPRRGAGMRRGRGRGGRSSRAWPRSCVADAAHYAGAHRRRTYAALVTPLAKGYSHVVAARHRRRARASCRAWRRSSTWRRSPRSSRWSRPTPSCARSTPGNAFATVQSPDAIKVVTVRSTGFDEAAATGSRADRGDRRPGPTRRKSKLLSARSSRSRRAPSWSARGAWSPAAAGSAAARTSS